LEIGPQRSLSAPEWLVGEKPMARQAADPTEAKEIDNDGHERDLVLAAQRGDMEAFRKLYDAHRERIWSLVVFSIGDSQQAQDVLQVVFLKVFRGIRSFRFQSKLFTWIYRIARNECRNHRRRRGAPHVPLEAILGSHDEIDMRLIGNDHLELMEREVMIQRAVMQLPIKMREVVVLKYLEELSYREIGQVLGCAAGTVASRLNRALAELEERLRPFARRI
jgi:RNA polymerase sigma-70 factor (ECF subfamily)